MNTLKKPIQGFQYIFNLLYISMACMFLKKYLFRQVQQYILLLSKQP